jgi:hypothetical protein
VQLIPVSSSNIASIGYETSTQTLQILFHSGGLYQYSGVPQSIHNGIMSAPSHGQYFHRNIKDVYSFVKLS